MKPIFLSVLLASLIIAGCEADKTQQPENTGTGNEYGSFLVKRGTNIAHWLSQSESRGNERGLIFY